MLQSLHVIRMMDSMQSFLLISTVISTVSTTGTQTSTQFSLTGYRQLSNGCNCWASGLITVTPGLAHSSPLLPILSNVYPARVTRERLDGRGRILSYVDGIPLYRHGKDRARII